MAAGTLRLANVTVFEANTVSNNIMVPSGTTLEGITDVLNLSLDSASFSTSTSVLSLGRVSGANAVTVDLSSLSLNVWCNMWVFIKKENKITPDCLLRTFSNKNATRKNTRIPNKK